MEHYKYLDKNKPVEGLFGLELETEGRNLPLNEFLGGTRWEAVPDHSLRDGIEYVSNRPLKKEEAIKAVQDLKKIFNNRKSIPSYSFRTSTHVHVNYTDASHNQILNAIITSMLLETVLVNNCAPSRIGNRFCLRLIDAEGIVDTLKELFTSFNGRNFSRTRYMDNNEAKYCATNLVPLFTLGTIEYRALQGTMDTETIEPWLDALSNIKEYALESEDCMSIYLDASLNTSEWARKVLGNVADVFLYDGFEIDITTNLSLLIDVVYSTKKPYVISPDIPEIYYHPPLHVGGFVSTDVVMDERYWEQDMMQHVRLLEDLPVTGVINQEEDNFIDAVASWESEEDFYEDDIKEAFVAYQIAINEIKLELINNAREGKVSLPEGFIDSHKITRESELMNRSLRLGIILDEFEVMEH